MCVVIKTSIIGEEEGGSGVRRRRREEQKEFLDFFFFLSFFFTVKWRFLNDVDDACIDLALWSGKLGHVLRITRDAAANDAAGAAV